MSEALREAALLDAAADVRAHHAPNEWDSCVACHKDWPCDAELLAELVVTRAALATPDTALSPNQRAVHNSMRPPWRWLDRLLGYRITRKVARP